MICHLHKVVVVLGQPPIAPPLKHTQSCGDANLLTTGSNERATAVCKEGRSPLTIIISRRIGNEKIVHRLVTVAAAVVPNSTVAPVDQSCVHHLQPPLPKFSVHLVAFKSLPVSVEVHRLIAVFPIFAADAVVVIHL